MKIAIASLLLLAVICSAEAGPRMKCRVVVPKKYRKTPFNRPPNGQPEPARYTVAYEAFWWNCVAVLAIDLEGRCPFVASGTPAASAGASDGTMNAEEQIEKLLKKYSEQEVQNYLHSLAAQIEAKEKMSPYFDKPTREVVR